MIQIKIFDQQQKISEGTKKEFIDFLFLHLEEFGDPKADIGKAVDYALSEEPNKGGFILLATMNNRLAGGLVMNKTGMQDYIPENILVYIATHKDQRGKGIGKQLMKYAAGKAMGSIALHVEPDNPARHLYTSIGFTNKYLEMRLIK
jgi:ribosomal protein S18 acetylase RimI-like enzyme